MKRRMERKGRTPDSYRLSHFVAPLYVAPSTTPSNATPEASSAFALAIYAGIVR